MGKKLLSVYLLFSIFFLASWSGFGQTCPTSVSISASPGTAICAATPVTFTANIQDNTSFNYKWYVGTSEVGTDDFTFSSSSLSNGAKVKVVITSADATNDCITSSNELTMTVNAVKTPTVSISSSKTSICPGESLSFTASNTNGGTSPQYSWYINSSNTVSKTGASVTFSSSDFTKGDNTVRVVLTSNVNCASTSTAEATSASFVLKPDATISTPANKDQTLCINTALQNISFALGGGATNGTVTGLPPGVSGSLSGGNYIISGSPTTKGTFSYTVTTTGTCAQTTATGTITVNPNATIALTSGNNSQTVCASGGAVDGSITPIMYSVGETATGAVASGLPTGINGSFNNGVFTIQGASSAVGTHNYSVKATGTCGESASLTGSIVITGNKAPSVSITSSDEDNNICAGTSVTFTATPTNGGSNPTYQWKINGANAGTNNSTFTINALTTGQTVTVEMSSSETCLTTATVTSNSITTTVNPNLTPTVTIKASDSDICPNDSVTFTATPENGGASPTYQWKVGNTNAGTNSPTFTTSSLTDGQTVTVVMTSSETCLASATATSNSIETNVNPDLVPSVTITSNDSNNIICSGSSITFTATPVNGGGTPSYQWKVGSTNVGTNSSSFNTSSLTNGQIVTVVMTASDDICLGQTTSATSNSVSIQVDNSIASETPQWDNSNPVHNPTAICPSVSGLKYRVAPITGATSYDWTLPSGWSITNGQGSLEITVTASVNATAGNITVNGRSECGPGQSKSLAVTTGTAAHVGAGADQTVCPGTTEITLAGEIGGVITQSKDWDWSASINGGSFTTNGFSNGGNSLDGTYTIPTSVRNGGKITIRIQSVKPAGNCDIKTDEMTLTIQSAASISDPALKNQTVCINSTLTPISFNIGGASQGATTTGLPAGVTGSFANGNYTLSGSPTVAGTFNYTVTTTGNCVNASRTGTITVNPRPTFTQPQEVVVCAGGQTSAISFGGSSVSGTTYQWTNDNTSIGLAASGTGNIISFTASNSTNEPLVANISVTPISNNCEGTAQNFQITVYPTATFTAPEDLTICNGETTEDVVFVGSNVSGTTYKWSNNNPYIGLAAEGSGNISSFSAINTTNAPIDATITVTPAANGCDGTPEEFTITVNPTPAFTAPENIVVCNGEDLSQLDFTGATVTGTTYSWTNSNIAIGLAASGTGNLPSFSAENTGNEPISATISVIPEANECDGEPVTFEIIVNPTSTVNTIEDVIVCNGEELPAIVLSSNVTGTSYSWTNSNPAIGLAGTGTGNIPTFTAENNSEQAVNATITITPTANECGGTPYFFNITVNPSATVDAGPDQTICSNGVATMAAILGGGVSEGTWTTSGSGTFNNNTVNAGYTPSDSDVLNGSVILTYTSNDPDGPCGAISDTMELTINEEVKITTEPENIGICSTEPSQLTVIASGDNLTYEWKRTDGANITNSNGIYSSTLSFNNTTSTNAGEYYVIVRGEDVCNEGEQVESARVTINVDENIVIEEPVTEVPICGDGFSEVTMKFIAHANGSPLTFTWYKDYVKIDATLDSNITITTGPPDENGRYEGTLQLVNITTAYNGDYFVEITGPENFTCSTAVTNPFQLRLDEMPALPVVDDLVVCQNETPEAFTVTTGTDLKWYINETDTEFIVNEAGQPIAPVPPTDVPGDFYYWVTQQPEACESEKVQVKVTVKEKPSVPVMTSAEAVVEYCLGETAVQLTATGSADSTLNWYSYEGEAFSEAPLPDTESPGETFYWVSQTPNDGFGCESDRALITVTVFALPEVSIVVDETIALTEEGNPVICSGSEIILTGNGARSYTWIDDAGEIYDGASITISPEITTLYTVTGTSDNGCEVNAEVLITVDEPTVPGTLTGPESVCISSPSGTFNLADYTGEIVRWETSTDGGTNWTAVAINSAALEFTDLTTTTIFRAIVKNGVCNELPSNQVEVTIDPLPMGGDLAFAGNGRVFTICENPIGNYAVDLNLTDVVGEVVRWGYRSWDVTGYTTLNIGGEVFTGNTITAAQIQALGFNETTVFQVEVSNGSCTTPALSKTAILSVIPSDITPSPVTVDPGVVCLGEEVTLSSETGYETGGTFLDQGAFDNASITNHGWRIRRNNNPEDLGFNTDANNTVFDRWKRGTPRQFVTAFINSPYNTSGVLFDTGIEDGNKGFALVSANNSSTMETPVFTIGSMDQAILTFDQAYVLTPGASLKVEISTDGGNTYTTLYIREVPADATQGIASGNTTSFGTGTIDSHPENKILIDLGDYMGRPNLRIRFNYIGARSGDIWAVDNIDIPEGPNGIIMEWRDYTDTSNPEGVLIGNNNSEQWPPTQVGLNIFEIKTKLVYNSSGDACEVAENAQRVEVFVFDKYTTSVTADYGSCGNFNAQLTATVVNGTNDTIQNYPTLDGYIGKWELVGEAILLDSDTTDEIDAINDPNAILAATGIGTFNVSWILERTSTNENGELYVNPEACPPVVTPLDVVIEGCIALDFDGENDRIVIDNAYAGVVSIEAWIRPERTGGTIISGPNFKITTPAGVTLNSRWHHIAVSNGKLYLDGIEESSLGLGNGVGSQTIIGAELVDGEAANFFSGWIEEVRLWTEPLTEEQIQFMMNQRLIANGAQMGEQIPMDVPSGLNYADLAGYYRLISSEPEPLAVSPVVYLAEDMPANGLTPNRAGTKVPGRLINMETNQQNTAPLPYYSGNDGAWGTDVTWLRPDVWDPPHTGGIEWNIVKTSHNITADRKTIVLGLLSEVNTLEMVGTNPTGWVGGGTGNPLRISHYLNLDGVIDLQGESQLLQPMGSIVDGGSTGSLQRDQQGTANSYNYNYWSSPVSPVTGNADYTVAGVLRDGTNPANPVTITFGDPYAFADGGKTAPIRISNYWISTFFNGAVDDYGSWNFQYGSEKAIKVGEGYTMKGTSGAVALLTAQNYTFVGLPNNGDINLTSISNRNYLIGNPYPSAIDAEEFIMDNLGPRNGGENYFDGTLYYWDHFGKEDSHILLDYVGGYAAQNLSGAVPAISIDERINDNLDENDKYPGAYIPVGQGFFVNTSDGDGYTISNGKIQFKNSLRRFVTENTSTNSQFLKPEVPSKKIKENNREKIRISYKSPLGYNRQILVGAHPSATNGFDLGYDAPLFDYNKEDMYWIQESNWLVIQGVSNFDKEQVLPLGIVLEEEGEFTIKIDTLENMEDNKMVYIRDILNDTIHNLTKEPFVATSKGGYINDRFEIIFYKDEVPIIKPGQPGGPSEPKPGETPPGLELDIRHGHDTNQLQISNPLQVDITNVYVYDLNGKLLQTYYNIANEKVVLLPVRNFSSGVYIVKLNAENQVISKKIIINN